MRSVFQIVRPVIGIIGVNVVHFLPFRTRPDESGGDKDMHGFSNDATLIFQIDLHVAFVIGPWLEQIAGMCSGRTSLPTHPPHIRHAINIFKSNYGPPFFIRQIGGIGMYCAVRFFATTVGRSTAWLAPRRNRTVWIGVRRKVKLRQWFDLLADAALLCFNRFRHCVDSFTGNVMLGQRVKSMLARSHSITGVTP